MKRKRILLLAIHKLRDLPGLALLKAILEARYGYEVMPAAVGSIGLLLPSFRPHLVIFPWMWTPQDVALAKELRQMGIGVAVLLAEGFSQSEQFRLQIAGKFTDLSPVDMHFVWNEGTAELMRVHKTIPEDRIFVAGVPRFDFYRPPLQRLLLTKTEYCAKFGLQTNRPIVTWATNFGYVKFVGHPEVEPEAQKANEAVGLRDFPPYGSFSRAVSVEQGSREILTTAMVRLASEFREISFVIKVSPGEDDQWYLRRQESAGLKNLAIIRSEYIWDVLNSSDLHLHRADTTATEAWLLGKPTIDLRLNPDEVRYAEDMTTGGDVARSTEELMERTSYYLSGGEITPEKMRARESLIRKWFYQVDGKSSERHVEVIHQFLETHASEPRIPWDWTNLSMIAKARLRRLLGLEPHESLLEAMPFFQLNGRSGAKWSSGDKDRYFTSREVGALVEKFSRVLEEAGRVEAGAGCGRAD